MNSFTLLPKLWDSNKNRFWAFYYGTFKDRVIADFSHLHIIVIESNKKIVKIKKILDVPYQRSTHHQMPQSI